MNSAVKVYSGLTHSISYVWVMENVPDMPGLGFHNDVLSLQVPPYWVVRVFMEKTTKVSITL